jgi:hypothetical protein
MFAIPHVQKSVISISSFSFIFLEVARICVCMCVRERACEEDTSISVTPPSWPCSSLYIYRDWFANSLQISLLYFCKTAGLVVM